MFYRLIITTITIAVSTSVACLNPCASRGEGCEGPGHVAVLHLYQKPILTQSYSETQFQSKPTVASVFHTKTIMPESSLDAALRVYQTLF